MDKPARQTNGKDQLLSIGKFAEVTGLSVSAVRFYANRGVLHPAAVDERSGYRRFAEGQVADGQLIKDLRRLEMPLASIAEALAMSTEQRRDLVQRYLDQLTADVGRVHAIAHTLGTTPPDPSRPTKDTLMTNSSPLSPAPVSHTNGSVTLPARALGVALSQVLPVAGTDPATPHLMTVLAEARDGSLRIVATDRHRLAVRDLVPTSIDANLTVVVAAATASNWALDVDGDLTITVTNTAVSLSGAVQAEATPVPASYPDYQSVLDTPVGVTSVTTDPTTLAAALAGHTEPVTLVVSDVGVAVNDSEHIESTHTGPQQSVLLNPAFLRDALAATVGRDVVIDIADPLLPLVIRSADDGTFTTLVMPIAPQ